MVSYCGPDHQAAHRDAHKKQCNTIKRCRETVDRQRVESDADDDVNTYLNELIMGPGFRDNRKYMSDRFCFIESLLDVSTRCAVEQAFTHIIETFKICPWDDLCLRCFFPSVLLRLGMDQECYDFLKWWCNYDLIAYDWDDADLPYYKARKEDVFEPCDFFEISTDLDHLVAGTLFKIRLLISLQSMQDTLKVCEGKVPQEVADMIQWHAAGTLLQNRPDILALTDYTPHIAAVKEQVRHLFRLVSEENMHFWPILIHCRKREKIVLAQCLPINSLVRARVILQDSFNSWEETPGSVDIIGALYLEHVNSGPQTDEGM